HLVPGDPVEIMLGETAAPADVAALRRDLGLDRPLPAQYARFLARGARGDLGKSIAFRTSVTRAVAGRYPATLELAGAAFILALGLALPLGVAAALRPGSAVDRTTRLASLAGTCLPGFWLGPLLILLFSLRLGWLPVSGRGGLAHLVLPATTLGLGMSAILVRLVRTSMIAALGEDFVRSARANGAPEWRVVAVHALRNALLPVTTVAGLQAGALLALALAGAAAPLLAPDPYATDLRARLALPRPGHALGQDSLGRDVLARVMHGARISFAVGATVVALSLLLGVTVGAAAGYLGGWFDEAVARVIDVLLAFPGLLLAIALA